MKEKRKLLIEVEAWTLDNNRNIVRIIEQSHRNERFVPMKSGTGLRPGSSFLSSNGVKLKSAGCPEWREESKTLFVRGSRQDYDTIGVEVSRDDLKQILFAIKEYNMMFGDKIEIPDFIPEWDRLFFIE
jgi:hypothetical protein